MTQIITTIFLALLAWMAFKSLRAFSDNRSQVRGAGAKGPKTAKQGSKEPIEAMKECPVCQTFRPESRSTPCGRADCPYGN